MNFRMFFCGIYLLNSAMSLLASPDTQTIYRSDIKYTVRSIADSYIKAKNVDLYALPNKIQSDYANSLTVAGNLLLETCWNQGTLYIHYDQIEMVTKQEVDKFIKIAKSVVLKPDIDKKINDFLCDLLHKNGLTKDDVLKSDEKEFQTLHQHVKNRLNKIMANHFCSYVYTGEIDTAVIEEFTSLIKHVKDQDKIDTSSTWQDFWDWLFGKDTQSNNPTPKTTHTCKTYLDYDIIHSYEIEETVLEISNQFLIDSKYEPENIPARVVSDYSDAVQKIISRTKDKMGYLHSLYAYEVKKLAEEELQSIIDKIRFKGEICSICLDEIRPKEVLGFLDCGHFFHKDCIEKSLNYRCKCPLCGTYTDKIDHTEKVPK